MSATALTMGILTLIGVPLAWSTMGAIRTGFIFAAIAAWGIRMAKNDIKSKGLSTAAQIVCTISAVLNFIIAFAFTR